MTPTLLIIFGLATWRVSSLLVNEGGPFGIFLKLRRLAGIVHDNEGKPLMVPNGFFAELLSCVFCSSIWVGTGWLIFWLLFPYAATILATAFSFSTIAILLDRYISQ
jgi:hypothetical protein